MSWRVVTRPDGSRWHERDLPGHPGTVEREWISGGNSIIRGGGTCSVIERGRTRSAPSATQSAPPFLPGLAPSYQVSLTSKVLEQIQRECRAMWFDCRDGVMHETGGYLLANASRPDHVVVATQPGDDARYSPKSVYLGGEHVEEIKRSFPNLAVVGDWHVHPGNNDGIPSPQDRRSWDSHRGIDGVDWFAGIVVTEGERGGWADPQLHGWITTDLYCERLALREL